MSKWRKIDVSQMLPLVPDEVKDFKGYVSKNGLKVLVSNDHGRWHMSISRDDRIPNWHEIKSARERFLPIGKHFVMALPPPQHYVNVHPFTLHPWECLPEREKDLIWTFEQG